MWRLVGLCLWVTLLSPLPATAKAVEESDYEGKILELVNTASAIQLQEMGFHLKVIEDILAHRPYDEIASFKNVPTVQAYGYLKVLRYWQSHFGPRVWRDGLKSGVLNSTIYLPALIDIPNATPCGQRDSRSIVGPPSTINAQTPAKNQITLVIQCTLDLPPQTSADAAEKIQCKLAKPFKSDAFSAEVLPSGYFNIESKELNQIFSYIWRNTRSVETFCKARKNISEVYLRLSGNVGKSRINITGALFFTYSIHSGNPNPASKENLMVVKGVAPSSGFLQ
jgi:hypothetical protein